MGRGRNPGGQKHVWHDCSALASSLLVTSLKRGNTVLAYMTHCIFSWIILPAKQFWKCSQFPVDLYHRNHGNANWPSQSSFAWFTVHNNPSVPDPLCSPSVHPPSETSCFNSSPLRHLSFDWLPLINMFEQLVGGVSTPCQRHHLDPRVEKTVTNGVFSLIWVFGSQRLLHIQRAQY